MIRKVFLLLAVILVTPGRVEPRSIWRYAAQQQKIDRILPFEKKNISHHPIALATEQLPAGIIIILCVLVFLITLLLCYSKEEEFPVRSTKQFSTSQECKVVTPNSSIQPFFMPHEAQICIDSLYQDMKNAKEKICIASYWVTNSKIILALQIARKRNVSIEIIFDKSTPGAAILQQEFREAGIKFTQSEVDSALMHHKFVIVDNNITWVGSANLTLTAFSNNYENMIRIESPEIAKRYHIDFQSLVREFKQS